MARAEPVPDPATTVFRRAPGTVAPARAILSGCDRSRPCGPCRSNRDRCRHGSGAMSGISILRVAEQWQWVEWRAYPIMMPRTYSITPFGNQAVRAIRKPEANGSVTCPPPVATVRRAVLFRTSTEAAGARRRALSGQAPPRTGVPERRAPFRQGGSWTGYGQSPGDLFPPVPYLSLPHT